MSKRESTPLERLVVVATVNDGVTQQERGVDVQAQRDLRQLLREAGRCRLGERLVVEERRGPSGRGLVVGYCEAQAVRP